MNQAAECMCLQSFKRHHLTLPMQLPGFVAAGYFVNEEGVNEACPADTFSSAARDRDAATDCTDCSSGFSTNSSKGQTACCKLLLRTIGYCILQSLLDLSPQRCCYEQRCKTKCLSLRSVLRWRWLCLRQRNTGGSCLSTQLLLTDGPLGAIAQCSCMHSLLARRQYERQYGCCCLRCEACDFTLFANFSTGAW